ncbi:hypothetical protein SAURM35S_06913 [Streptomyces aurantiogriseus]
MAGSGEVARHWQYADLPGVDLLRARYVRKTFVRHTHEHFVIAGIAEGVDVFHHRGGDQYAGAGALALVNPDTPHTGRAGGPEGWRYGAVYPSPEVVAGIAAETDHPAGHPGVASVPVLDDPYSVSLVHQVLRAADEGNALAADTLLRVAVDAAAAVERRVVQDRDERGRRVAALAADGSPGRAPRRRSDDGGEVAARTRSTRWPPQRPREDPGRAGRARCAGAG